MRNQTVRRLLRAFRYDLIQRRKRIEPLENTSIKNISQKLEGIDLQIKQIDSIFEFLSKTDQDNCKEII